MVFKETVSDKSEVWIRLTSYLHALRTNKLRLLKIKTMYRDKIIEEIHKNREEYAKSFNYDLDAIFQDLKNKQASHSHKIAKLKIKRK